MKTVIAQLFMTINQKVKLAETKNISMGGTENETYLDKNQSKTHLSNRIEKESNEPQLDPLNEQNMKALKIILQKLDPQEIKEQTKNRQDQN